MTDYKHEITMPRDFVIWFDWYGNLSVWSRTNRTKFLIKNHLIKLKKTRLFFNQPNRRKPKIEKCVPDVF